MISTKSFQEIFKVLPTPGLILLPNRPEFTVVAVNNAYLNLTNFSEKELVGKRFIEISSNKTYYQILDWRKSLSRVVSTKSADKILADQYVTFSKGNEDVKKYFEVSNVPVLNKQGEVIHIVCSFLEVTDRVALKSKYQTGLDKLRRNEQFLHVTEKLVKSGSWEIDMINSKVTWSNMLKEIFDLPLDFKPQLISLFDYFKKGEDRSTFGLMVEKALNEGLDFDVELKVLTAKGAMRVVRATGKPELLNGKCSRLFGAIQDVTDKKNIDHQLLHAYLQYKSILQNIDGVIWEMNVETKELLLINEQLKPILGHSAAEWQSSPDFWKRHLHPHDRELVADYLCAKRHKADKFIFECRMARADGRYVWLKNFVSVVAAEGKPILLRGLMVDISENKRLNDFEYFEKKILRLNAKKGTKLEQILMAYLLGLEEILPDAKGSLHQVKHNRLYNWAAPSLPRQYIDAMDGLSLSKSVGTCGAASFLRQPVIVHDIENDLRWSKFRDAALAVNLRACWSYPVISPDGEVMATLGLYYSEPKSPNEHEELLIQRANAFLKIILESRIYSADLEGNVALLDEGQHLAKFGNWSWDTHTDIVIWSDYMYEVYGLDKKTNKITFEGYLDYLHYEDKERVSATIGGVLSTKKGVEFYERIVRPDGEVRHLKSWCKAKLDEHGQVSSVYGACLDVTESKKTEEQLFANEAKLRDLVDSQTNFVIRIDFKGKFTYCNRKYEEVFGWCTDGADLIGSDSMKSVSPHHFQQAFDAAEQCLMQPNTVYQVEIDKIAVDGKVISTLWDMVCLTDEKGSPSEIQGIGIDITGWKLTKNSLSKSTARHKYADQTTNAMYDWNIIEDNISWGESYYLTYGHQKHKEKYPLERWVAKVHPDDAERIVAELYEVLADVDKHSWFSDYQLKTTNGEHVWIEIIGHTIREQGTGKAIRMVGVVRDISERKVSESKLNVLHERYRDLFQHSPQPMWIYEVDTLKFADVNEAAIKCYGYSREEFLSANTTMIRLAEDMHRYLKVMESANQEKNMVFQGVFRHQKKDGKILHMDIRSNPIRFNDKETYLVLASDITDRLTYFEGIEKQNEKLKEIAWMQSHVVRAPLTRMMSLIDLLRNDETVNADNDQLFEYLLSSALELDEIVKDISVKTPNVK